LILRNHHDFNYPFIFHGGGKSIWFSSKKYT